MKQILLIMTSCRVHLLTHINKKQGKKMKSFLLIILFTSIGVWADFSKRGNIVTDSITKLQWQDDAVGEQMSWQEAIKHCEGLSLDGYSDWRLPTINELKSIIDRSKYEPAIVKGFENTSSSNSFSVYWSSTTHPRIRDNALAVKFYSATVSTEVGKYKSFFVRCVRAGQ